MTVLVKSSEVARKYLLSRVVRCWGRVDIRYSCKSYLDSHPDAETLCRTLTSTLNLALTLILAQNRDPEMESTNSHNPSKFLATCP